MLQRPGGLALVIGVETLSKLIDWQGGYFKNCRAGHLPHLRRLLLEKGGKISAWSSGEVIKTSFL